MTVLFWLTISALWVALWIWLIRSWRRDHILSWLVDRTGVEDPPAVELVELDDDMEDAWLEIVTHYGEESR